MYAAGNPALKMQHWMKNQLAKESYAEQWEDIVRAGAASSVKRNSRANTNTPAQEDSQGQFPATGSASVSRLPAEFGTNSKVPAKGTAPMGPQDYADGSQWTEREGTMQRRESDENSAKADGARDRGYIGGDGAELDGAVRQQATDGAKDLASFSGHSSGRDQEGSADQASRKQPQGSTQLPDQASASGAGGSNGAGPVSSSGAGPSAASSASSNGSKPHGGKGKSASNDSDWWREVTAASRKNDCSSTASSLSPKQQHRQNGANGSTAETWNNTKQDEMSVQQNGSASPSSSSPTSSSASKNSAGLGSRSSSPSETVSYGKDTSSMHGLEGQSQRASSSNSNASLSPEDKADIERRTQEVKELASQIESQVCSSYMSVQSKSMSCMCAFRLQLLVCSS